MSEHQTTPAAKPAPAERGAPTLSTLAGVDLAMGNRQPASWAGMLLEAMSLEAIEVEESEATKGRTGT